MNGACSRAVLVYYMNNTATEANMRIAMVLGMAAAVAAAGCSQARSENGGPTVERNYGVGNFDRIDLAGAYDVTVRTGAAPGVKARGDEKMIERLVVEVRDGVLRIHPKKESGFRWGRSHHGKLTVSVTVPSLRGAQLAGAGDVRIDEVKGAQFDGGIAGAGDLVIDRIDVGALKLGIAGAGSAKAVSGRAKSAAYDIAGSGDIDAKGITTETASVSIAGAGSVEAHAANTASVSIMGAGDVDVTGGAKCTVSKAGAGNVRCS
jgi:hypothetical protein